MPKQEEKLSIALSSYINAQYPDVVFFVDASGVRLTIGQAISLKKQRSKNFKIPDFWVISPNNKYHGLVLELKREGEDPYLKDGTLSKGKHIQDQEKTLSHLRKLGYCANFATGFDEAKIMVDEYLRYR